MVTLVATLVAGEKAPWQPSLAMRCLDHLDDDNDDNDDHDHDHDRADNGADDEIEDEGEDGDDDACLSGCGWGEGEIHSLQTQAICTRLGEINANQIIIIFIFLAFLITLIA